MVEISASSIFLLLVMMSFMHLHKGPSLRYQSSVFAKDWPKHFSKSSKLFLIFFLSWFRWKGHGFLNPWFSFFPMFSRNKVSFIRSFILRLWVIKINNMFYLSIIIWLFIIVWLGVFMNIIIIFFNITR